jgi:hypothetical protein
MDEQVVMVVHEAIGMAFDAKSLGHVSQEIEKE